MIEIFGIYLFCKRLGARLRRRGVPPLRFQFLLIVFWFVGEIFGGFIGAVIANIADGGIHPRGSISPVAYCGAIIGALLGAIFAYKLADWACRANALDPPSAFPVEPALAETAESPELASISPPP